MSGRYFDHCVFKKVFTFYDIEYFTKKLVFLNTSFTVLFLSHCFNNCFLQTFYTFYNLTFLLFLTLKRLGVNLTPFVVFPKICFFRERVKPCFFVTFCAFPQNLHTRKLGEITVFYAVNYLQKAQPY